MFCVTLGQRPLLLPRDTYSKIQRRGINYEKRVARDLVHLLDDKATVLHGQWLFKGSSFCQPDLIVLRHKKPTLVLEVKLTHKKAATKKLWDLYVPMVLEAFPGPIACGQVYRNAGATKPDSCFLEYLLDLKNYKYGEVMWK